MKLYENVINREAVNKTENDKILSAYDKVLKEQYGPKEISEDKLVEDYFTAVDILNYLEKQLAEKWDKKVKIQHTGQYTDWDAAKLKKAIKALRGKPGNKEKMGELLFALRAKEHWPKGKGSTGV